MVKNKKKKNWLWRESTTKDEIISFIVIGVIFILILGIIIYFNQEQHFRIFKEECSEELEFKFSWNDVRAKKFNITHKQILEITYSWLMDYVLECPDNIQDCFIYENKTTCEKVEVDEILDEEFHYWFVPKNRTLKTTDEFEREQCETKNLEKMYGFQGVWVDKGDYFACLKLIEEKDITKSWLEENCECVAGMRKGKIIKCDVYKCEFDETYYVETWKQAK